MDAYLDIETTGLSSVYSYITVIGIYLVDEDADEMVQIVGDDITPENLLKALEGVETIYTYNGGRFDIPFIKDFMGVDLLKRHKHIDLMLDCWRCKLYGGFKAVEVKLGIERELQGIGGWDAVLLWRRHQEGDAEALPVLLKYNQEDVKNLKTLKERLKKHPLY
ncbi:MAG: ribonuclease H-like domain-containing protein [Dehalococcoidales bacterium]|nr:ribonuclease H-like domain-containing protein [Dehalococcoidales bacterium]